MRPAVDLNTLWQWDTAAEVLPELLTVFVKVTLLVTVVGTIVAALLGLLLAVLAQILPVWLSKPLRWAMDVIRMTPLIIQLIFASFVVPTSWPLLWVDRKSVV